MVSEDRQRVIETNRSLRLIKNELESLLEKGIITDAAFDSISALLPAESPLSSGARNTNQPLPTPAPSAASPAATPSPAPSQQQQPPSYAQSAPAAAANPPPALPSRTAAAAAPPPPPPPAKPVLARARALYRYAATDARDVSLERDDRVAVHQYMNADWWMGRNERTGQEGIFPRSYVVVLAGEEGDEKQQQQPQFNNYNAPVAVGGGPGGGGYYPVAPVPVGGYYPPAPQAVQQQEQQQPQQQQQQEGGNKMGEHGKKFGKKLGNAAIFGAGATIGSNLVNSIF